MAHDLFEHDHAFYGSERAAWHRLGTVVKGQPTSADAIRHARLDWRVIKEPAYADFGGDFRAVRNVFYTVREDLPAGSNDRVLGVVSGRYQPIQNTEAFGIADALIGEGGAQFESAGSLKNGRRVWMLAQLPEQIRVKDDVVGQYLLLHNSHDGSSAMEACITPIRVVCNNTLTWALAGAKTRVKIRHTRNARDQISEARKILGLAGETFQQVGDKLNELAETRVNPAFVKTYLQHLIPDPAAGKNNTRAAEKRNRIGRLFAGGQLGSEQVAVRGTAYGLYNSVTQYIDRDRSVRTAGGSAMEARLDASWFGAGADFRQGAMTLLLDNLDVAGYGDSLDYVKPPDTPIGGSVLDGIEIGNRN